VWERPVLANREPRAVRQPRAARARRARRPGVGGVVTALPAGACRPPVAGPSEPQAVVRASSSIRRRSPCSTGYASRTGAAGAACRWRR